MIIGNKILIEKNIIANAFGVEDKEAAKEGKIIALGDFKDEKGDQLYCPYKIGQAIAYKYGEEYKGDVLISSNSVIEIYE